MKTHIWIVSGATGEYSDHREWAVCAYCLEKDAREHAEKADAKAKDLAKRYDRHYEIPHGANEYDSRMTMDYTGTNYYVEMIELADAPQALQAWMKLRN